MTQYPFGPARAWHHNRPYRHWTERWYGRMWTHARRLWHGWNE